MNMKSRSQTKVVASQPIAMQSSTLPTVSMRHLLREIGAQSVSTSQMMHSGHGQATTQSQALSAEPMPSSIVPANLQAMG